MSPRVACLRWCLLLFLQTTRAALRVIVTPSVIQASPGTDIILPCHISSPSRPIELKHLAVIWQKDSEDVAKYEHTFEAKRPGAKMIVEKLQDGNASLVLPNVQATDDGVYTCLVIHLPDGGEGKVEVRVEAPPRLTHGPTKLQLDKPSKVTCVASDFYPGNISVTWLRDSNIVKGPEWATAHLNPNGLFSVESALEITPQIADANATISCQINHKAIKEPLRKDFQLQIQAQPILEVVTVPPEKTFCASICLVSRFYPKEIHIQWLRNGILLQETFETQLQTMLDGTFSTKSAIVVQEMDVKATYICRVQHESLDTPLEKEVFLLLAQGEGVHVTHHTPLSSQRKGKERTLPSSSPTAISLCPTDSSVSPSFSFWLLGIIGLIVGLAVGAGTAVYFFKHKAKRRKSEALLKNANEEKAKGTSKLKTEKTDVGLGGSKGYLEEDDNEYHPNMSEAKKKESRDTSVSVV